MYEKTLKWCNIIKSYIKYNLIQIDTDTLVIVLCMCDAQIN